MKPRSLSIYSAWPAIAAAGVVITLGTTGPAAAMGDAPDGRYEQLLQQEAVAEAMHQGQDARGQSVSSALDSDGGGDSYSPLEESPYHILNDGQHRGGADR